MIGMRPRSESAYCAAPRAVSASPRAAAVIAIVAGTHAMAHVCGGVPPPPTSCATTASASR